MNKQTLSEDLSEKGFNVNQLPKEVLFNALKNGYELVNNHFMAFVGEDKKYIDYWFSEDEDLKQISESLRYDSVIDKLNDGETLTLKEIFAFQRKLNKLIENYIINEK